MLISPKLKRVAEWIDVAERYADGLATNEDRQHVNQSMLSAASESQYRGHSISLSILHHAILKDASHANLRNAIHRSCQIAGVRTNELCDIFRDIFGNPFRPVAFDAPWRTTDAVGIARSMYDARDFAAMPILADALEDGGCDSADVLAHCRGGGPHVRGCWVVDLVLGMA
jgi:hypothetical protein